MDEHPVIGWVTLVKNTDKGWGRRGNLGFPTPWFPYSLVSLLLLMGLSYLYIMSSSTTTTTTSLSDGFSFGSWFVNFTSFIKFPVFFTLFYLSFFYLLFYNTLPIALLLLIFIHTAFGTFSAFDYLFGSKFFDYSRFDFSSRDDTPFISFVLYIIFIGFASSFVLLFVSIAIIIAVFDRLGFYRDKSNLFEYFDSKSLFNLCLVIVFLFISTIIIFILYAFNRFGLLGGKYSIDWITYTPIRLLSTTILLVSFIIYYSLTEYKNNSILVFGIVLSIVFYFFNIINKDIRKYKNPDKYEINGVSAIFFFFNAIASIIIIVKSAVSYVFMKHETHMIFIPLVTWFLISVYNMIVAGRLTKDSKENVMNMKYISSILIVILIVLSSLTVYYSSLLNNHFQVTTDDK
jgi:hypothetical protein